jgi:adenylate kinase family enzyme
MNDSIILIGPAKTGKTTVSKLLGESLALPVIDLDEARWTYYTQIGYEAIKAQEIAREGGIKALDAYWKPFNIYAVERVLQDYPSGHIIAFGWPHSIYDDEVQFERAEAALAAFPYVVLLIPSQDMSEANQIFRQRYEKSAPHFTQVEIDLMLEEIRDLIQHPSNSRLAKLTIYTAGKSPEETCQEVIQRCR